MVDAWSRYCDSANMLIKEYLSRGHDPEEAIILLRDYLKREDVKCHPMYRAIEAAVYYSIGKLEEEVS